MTGSVAPAAAASSAPARRASTLSLQPKDPVQIAFHDLTYDVAVNGQPKRLLHGISGHASPGQVLAIMGSSGAGKTTLLKLLSGRQLAGVMGGRLLANGAPVERKPFRRIAAFVTQDDLMLSTQTPREVLAFSAALRLPPSTSRAQRKRVVTDVLAMLHLEEAADTLVGDPAWGGISGGERKRVNIGAEMVTNPALIYVDEPTSGLDSYTALHVMATLRDIAAAGRTVVSTIHQPASEIFEGFGDLMLLHQGGVAYFGPRAAATGYFGALGVRCPDYHNPADFLITTLMTQLHGADPLTPDFLAAWAASKQRAEAASPPRRAGCETPLSLKLEPGAGVPLQISILLSRILSNWKRDKLGLRVRVAQTLFFSVFTGLLFWDLPGKGGGVQDLAGSLFFAVLNQMMLSLFGVVLIFPLERRVFEREHDGGYYGIFTYWFTRILFDVPHHAVFPVLFSCIFYSMARLRQDGGRFGLYLALVTLVAQSAAGLGLVIGCIVPSPDLAITIAPVIMMPLLLVGGLFLNNESLSAWGWVQVLSPMYW